MEWVANMRQNQTNPKTVDDVVAQPARSIVIDDQSLPRMDKGSAPEADELDAIVEMMPKQMGRKAKLLVHYIRNHISVSDNGRVIYDDSSIGSHLHDLVKFFVASPMLRVPRPIDAVKFGILLKRLGVPRAALGRDLTLIRDRRTTNNKHSSSYNSKIPNGSTRKLNWKGL